VRKIFTALDAPPAKLDEHEQNFVGGVRQHGWFGTHVAADDTAPGFSYTTGVWLKFEVPELIVFSLRRDIAHDTFWHIYRELEAGKRFPVGELSDNIFSNSAGVLLPVSSRQYRAHLGWSRWFYGNDDFQCLQLVWADRDGLFPWSVGASDGLRAAQPDLTDGNWSGLRDKPASA
jgi:uncharacterized protein DUF4262